jgi:topoisomerase-4 subunit A
MVFEPKTSKIDREEFVTTLLALTSMETSVAMNLVCIGTDHRPRQKGLREVLLEWIGFRTSTVLRRTRYRFDKITDRIHVLEGRMLVYLNVDEVIQTIRESDEPRPALMARFKLSERQADDILDMRLRQLARLEGFKIEQELAEKQAEQQKLRELIEQPTALKKLVVKEIEADSKLYGDERRTLIEVAERAVKEVRVLDEPVTVIVSQKGWLRSRQGHGHDVAQFNFKAGDGPYGVFECRSTDALIAFGDNGRVYSVAVSGLPSARGDGAPVTSMIDLEPGSHIEHMIAAAAESKWLLSTRQGFGFSTKLSDMTSRQRAGKQFVTLEEKDRLLRPVPLFALATHVAFLTTRGKLLVIAIDEVKSLASGGRGTILMGIDAPDVLAQTVPVSKAGLRVTGTYRTKQVQDILSGALLEIYISKRARKGRLLDIRSKEPILSPVL